MNVTGPGGFGVTWDGDITLDCPRCYRPLCWLKWQGDHADVVGTAQVAAGGTRVSKAAAKKLHRWSKVEDAGPGRWTVRCSCGISRPVTRAAATATYKRTAADGRTSVSLLEIRR